MPRGSRKRKATSQTPQEKKMWSNSSSRKKSSKSKSSSNLGEMEKLFDSIADPEDSTIATMEGISTLCEELELDIEDIRILVLLWKMNAVEKPAQISKQEWMTACTKLNFRSVDDIKKIMPSLDTGFLEQSSFRDFYKFCFNFNRAGTHRTLDKDLVVALLQLCLKGRVADDRLTTFCTFLEKSQYTRITLDQWTSFLDFCYDVEDLSAYDLDSSAWPVLIDEYVEYMEEQDKMDT